jgi:hypothetical protein
MVARGGGMKAIDRFGRWWRVKKALSQSPRQVKAAFDIGCDDGYLLSAIPGDQVRRDGCDPLPKAAGFPGDHFIEGYFPEAAPAKDDIPDGGYDAVFALAVFEHFQAEDLRRSSPVIAGMLAPRGRLIATVPHPFVDKILHVLIALHLIDGMEVHQHHGFDPRTLAAELPDLKLVKKKTFQLGLNNLFVFERA